MSTCRGWILVACVTATYATACGGTSRQGSTTTSAEASSSQATTTSVVSGASTSNTATLVLGAVTVQLDDPFVIGADGEVRLGEESLGVLTADGRLSNRGHVVAELQRDGIILLGGEDSGWRIDGDCLLAREEPSAVMCVSGDELVVDSEEHLAMVGFRPELTREVLFAMAMYTVALSRAYAH
ncbi:MAG: hypothetical protein K1X94_19730 [Sandaracinaceae bacterium]|nr:hypothetical protein [Sandaracinaceae bacterium]